MRFTSLWLLLCLGGISGASGAPQPVSYLQMVQWLEAADPAFYNGNPRGPFPQTHSVGGSDLLRALATTNVPAWLGGRWLGGDIGTQLLSITNPNEWSVRKSPAEDKYLHPRGVTFIGEWNITEDSEATGLFSKGTTVKVICRFSSGTSNSIYTVGAPRIFGASCMLFPTSDLSRPVLPLSILTLDSFGFDGAYRPLVFEFDPEGVNYFTSFAPAVDTKASSFNKGTVLGRMIFDAIDPPNAHRPVDHIASLDAQGEIIRKPHVPFEVRFYPRDWGQNESKIVSPGDDFRQELMNYDPAKIQFDIVTVESAPGDTPRSGRRLGTMRFEKAYINAFSELEMRFFHITHRAPTPAERDIAHLFHNEQNYAPGYGDFLRAYSRSMALWGVMPSRLAACVQVLMAPEIDPAVRSHQLGALKPLSNFREMIGDRK